MESPVALHLINTLTRKKELFVPRDEGKVRMVRNYTDVDDRIIEASGHDALRAFVIAEHWTRVFEEITGALGVIPPDIAPRASGHIPEMLELVAKLFDTSLA